MEVNLQPYSNLLVKPIIHEQLENKKLLITTSPFSGENILHQTYEDKEYNLNIYPGGRSVRWTKVFTKNTTLPYRTSFTVSCYGYKSFNFIFRNESYTEVGFNEILVSYTIDSEVFTFKCPQNYGGFIGTLETTSQREITFKIVLDTYEQIGDVNSILQIGVAFTQPYTAYLKNIESQVVLKTYPVTSPHGLSVIKRNESDVFNYNESSPTEIQIIRLFQNHSDNNVIEKNIELIDVYEGYITYQGSILSPTINIKDSKVLQSNYLEFVTLGKFYYIEDIITLGKDSYQLSLKVDVLMTYKDDILKQNGYVFRNEYDYNEYIEDYKLPMTNINDILVYESSKDNIFFNLTDTKYTDNNVNVLHIENNYCIVLTLANSVNVNTYPQLNNMIPFNFSYQGNQIYILTGQEYYYMIQTINDTSMSELNWLWNDLSGCFVNARLFPFDIKERIKELYPDNYRKIMDGTSEVYIANTKAERKIDKDTYYRWTTFDLPVSIPLNLGNITIDIDTKYKYLFCEPNLNCQLFLPFYGFTDISTNLYLNKNENKIFINIQYLVNLLTGECNILLRNYERFGTSTACQILKFNISSELSFPIGNGNVLMLRTMVNIFGSLLKLPKLGLDADKSAFKVNELEKRATKRTTPKTKLGRQIESAKKDLEYETIKGGYNVVSDLTLNQLNIGQYKLECGDSINDLNSFYYKLVPYIIIKYKNPAINDYNDYKHYTHYMGRPLNEYRSLSEIFGYTEIGAIHLDNLNNCLNYEKDEIEEYLKKGVYFPDKPQE